MTRRERKYFYSNKTIHFKDGIFVNKIRNKKQKKWMLKFLSQWGTHFPAGYYTPPTNLSPIKDGNGNFIYGLLPCMKTMNPAAGESVTITLTERDHLKY